MAEITGVCLYGRTDTEARYYRLRTVCAELSKVHFAGARKAKYLDYFTS